MSRRSRAMTFLELLARPAPARVVAPDLGGVVDAALLDGRQRLLLGVPLGSAGTRRRGHRHCSGRRAAAAGVRNVAVAARRRARTRAWPTRRRSGRNTVALVD